MSYGATMRLGLFAAVFFLSSGALAQPRLDPREANLRYEEGVALFGQRKFAESRVKFLEACAAQPTAKCTKNLGAAEAELGLRVQAATHFRAYLVDPASQKDTARPEVEKAYVRLRAECGELEIAATPGATLTLDHAAPLGTSPLAETVFVEPGAHSVAGRLGSVEKSESVVAEAGRVASVKLELAAPGTSAPPASTAERKQMWPPPAPALVLGAVGLGGVVVGAVLHGVAASKTSSLDPLGQSAGGICARDPSASPCAGARAIATDQRTLSAAAVTGYVAGGALLGAALVWWLAAPRRAPPSVAPVVGSVTGLVVQGSF